jgi:hypothetical protein
MIVTIHARPFFHQQLPLPEQFPQFRKDQPCSNRVLPAVIRDALVSQINQRKCPHRLAVLDLLFPQRSATASPASASSGCKN